MKDAERTENNFSFSFYQAIYSRLFTAFSLIS